MAIAVLSSSGNGGGGAFGAGRRRGLSEFMLVSQMIKQAISRRKASLTKFALKRRHLVVASSSSSAAHQDAKTWRSQDPENR
jgi:hypothetical protein